MHAAAADLHPWERSYPPGLSWRHPIEPCPVHALLDRAVTLWPDRPFLDFLGRVETYAAIDARVRTVAAGLRALGVGRGSRVGLLLPNCPYYVVAFFAALRLGATVVQFSTLLAEEEVAAQLADSATEILITLDVMRLLGRLEGVLRASRVRQIVVCSLMDSLPLGKRLLAGVLAPGERARWREDGRFLAWDRLLGHPPLAEAAVVDPVREPAAIHYTAGTTGRPKGVLLSHANLSVNAMQNGVWFTAAAPGRERLMAVLPFFHAYGLTGVLDFAISLGGELVLQPRFEPRGLLRTLRRTRPTVFHGVPALFHALLDAPGVRREHFASLKVCVSGGDALPPQLRRRFEAFTGVPLTQGYGLTECGPVVTCGNPLAGRDKPGSVGLPLPGTEVRILPPDGGAGTLPADQVGEIVVRGPQVMLGYAGRPEDTRAAFADGWLRTGDLGYLDAEGYLFVVDRLKDVIVTSGCKVYPHRVEEVLLAHPAVAEAAVVGAPDERRGAVPVAHLVLRPGQAVDADALRAYLAAKLSPPETPRRFIFRDALPRSPFGKVLRSALGHPSTRS